MSTYLSLWRFRCLTCEKVSGSECPDSVAIVDATEQRVERSHHYQTQKAHYSGKKKAHTRKTHVIVNEHGRIRDVSPSVPGSVHDATLLRQSKAADRIPPDVSAMGDSGYQGIQDDMSERSVALPYRASRGHPLTPEQKLHNHEISRIRIVVENTIAELKHFRSLVDVFHHAVARYDSVILAIVGIVSRRIDRRLESPEVVLPYSATSLMCWPMTWLLAHPGVRACAAKGCLCRTGAQ